MGIHVRVVRSVVVRVISDIHTAFPATQQNIGLDGGVECSDTLSLHVLLDQLGLRNVSLWIVMVLLHLVVRQVQVLVRHRAQPFFLRRFAFDWRSLRPTSAIWRTCRLSVLQRLKILLLLFWLHGVVRQVTVSWAVWMAISMVREVVWVVAQSTTVVGHSIPVPVVVVGQRPSLGHFPVINLVLSFVLEHLHLFLNPLFHLLQNEFFHQLLSLWREARHVDVFLLHWRQIGPLHVDGSHIAHYNNFIW